MSASYNKERWSEFDWEKELRKDDERVAAYLRALPKFIDLPNEDAVILKQLQRHPELVPFGGVWPSLQSMTGAGENDSAAEDAAAEQAFAEDWNQREGAEVYILAGQLARAACILFAENRLEENNQPYLNILTLLGKMMVRTSDMIDIEPEDRTQLRTALCKRLIADSSRLLEEYAKIRIVLPETAGHLQAMAEQTHLIREQLLDLLKKARSKPPLFPDRRNPDHGKS